MLNHKLAVRPVAPVVLPVLPRALRLARPVVQPLVVPQLVPAPRQRVLLQPEPLQPASRSVWLLLLWPQSP